MKRSPLGQSLYILIMACTNCSTADGGAPKGCNNNGTCGTDSCNKLSVFDWLSNMTLPGGQAPFDAAEIRFKNGRKEFFRNTEKLTLSIGDIVATEASPGHDIGIITLTGELVKIQMKKKGENPDKDLPKIYRKASQRDIDIWTEARNKEEAVRMRAREIAINLKLEMKISDVEFQGDGSKATFYYTANDRVDFRQLIKEFAQEFKIRIEMKQVGFRQEAARLGGIGSCGRELCCSTWLTDFRSVNTSAARYQQLSLNPQKLAGQCGKLKCCLNYELDSYLDALSDFPSSSTTIDTVNGKAFCIKIDVFKKRMWFAYVDRSMAWYDLDVQDVKKLISQNKKGEKAPPLEELRNLHDIPVKSVDLIQENNMDRFEKKNRNSGKNQNRKKPNGPKNNPNQKTEQKATGTPQRKNTPEKKPQNAKSQAQPQNAKPQNQQNQQPKKFKKKPQPKRDDNA